MRWINRYKGLNSSVKAAFWYTICNFLQKGISFIVVPIYVRMLTTAEYGKYSVFQSWRDILIIFASLNLYCGVYTKTIVDKPNERDEYSSSMLGLGTLVTVICLAIYLIFNHEINIFTELDTTLMLIMNFYFLVYPAFQFWSTRQRVENKYIKLVIVTLLVSVATPLLSIYLLLYTDLREKAVIFGYLIVQCAVGLLFYIIILHRGKILYNKDYWIYALNFNIPLIPHYLSLIVLGQSDRIMISHYCGSDDAGRYSFAYQIASVINVLISAINGSLVPWTYEQLKINSYGSIRKIANYLCILMAWITFLASLVAPEIISILGTKDYMSAQYVIPIVVLGVYCTFCYNLYGTIEFYYGETKFVMAASMVGAVSNVILNAIFIPIFGYIAAAYTTYVCYFIFMLMHYVFAKRVLKKKNIKETVYDGRFIFTSVAIISMMCIGCMIIFPYTFIRYAFLVVLCVVIVVKRKVIINKLKVLKK